ncbi:MAG: DUF3149 domain-containing protein [Burkholderiaceae bacterium]
MKLLSDLLHTDYGLMSLTVIAITLGMAVFFIRLFAGKMNESAAQATRDTQGPPPAARR